MEVDNRVFVDVKMAQVHHWENNLNLVGKGMVGGMVGLLVVLDLVMALLGQEHLNVTVERDSLEVVESMYLLEEKLQEMMNFLEKMCLCTMDNDL